MKSDRSAEVLHHFGLGRTIGFQASVSDTSDGKQPESSHRLIVRSRCLRNFAHILKIFKILSPSLRLSDKLKIPPYYGHISTLRREIFGTSLAVFFGIKTRVPFRPIHARLCHVSICRLNRLKNRDHV